MRNRFKHLAEGLRRADAVPGGAIGRTMNARLRQLEVLSAVRTGVLALLSVSLIAAAYGWIADQVGALPVADDALRLAARVVGTATTGLTLGLLALNRLLGQVEADVIVCMHAGDAQRIRTLDGHARFL